MAKETRTYETPNRMEGRYAHLWPPCFYCVHLIAIGFQDSAERWTCKAFPEGIPPAIWDRTYSHDWVWPGQKESFLYQSAVHDTDDGPMKISFAGDWVPA